VSWLDFIAVSEWPALIAAALALFRRQIGAIVARFAKGEQAWVPQLPKSAPLIDAAEEIAAERLSRTDTPVSAAHTPWQAAVVADIARLADADEYPSEYCLLRSWAAVERLARERAPVAGKKHLSMVELTAALKLDDDTVRLSRRLRDIRNRVADGELSVSPTDALRYRDLVVTLLQTLHNRDDT
jgi:hypothetical protein